MFENIDGTWLNTQLGFKQDNLIVGIFGGFNKYNPSYNPTDRPKKIII